MTNEEIGLKKFLQSTNYRNSSIAVCEAIEQALDENVPQTLLNDDIDQLQAAGISILSLQSVLQESREAFEKFSIHKYRCLQNANSDGEFPSNEPQPEDEKSAIETIHPMAANFLVSYLIEYFLAVQQPERLESYLKSMRYPFAKRYAKQLKEWAKPGNCRHLCSTN